MQVDDLTSQIKAMSANKDLLLQEQNAAVDNLKKKREVLHCLAPNSHNLLTLSSGVAIRCTRLS